MIMKQKLQIWLEYFLVFSFLGWIYESIWCSMIEQNKGFVNRGFLTGPYLPIYGTGICLIFFVLKGDEDKMTLGLAVELLANLVQQVLMFGFLTLLAFYGVVPLLEGFHRQPVWLQRAVLSAVSVCFLFDLSVHLIACM